MYQEEGMRGDKKVSKYKRVSKWVSKSIKKVLIVEEIKKSGKRKILEKRKS